MLAFLIVKKKNKNCSLNGTEKFWKQSFVSLCNFHVNIYFQENTYRIVFIKAAIILENLQALFLEQVL